MSNKFKHHFFIRLFLFILLSLSLTLPINEIQALAEETGSGTIDSPYLIYSVEDLKGISNELGAHYKLMNDIDLKGEEWTPIGTNSATFTGTLDGNGYKVHNLVIDQSSIDYIGLFGYTSNATIKSLELNDIQITGKNYVGSLIGIAAGTTIIENVKLTGNSTVSGANYVGGLVGNVRGALATEIKLTENSTVHGASYVGGLFGSTNAGTLNKSYALGTVTGSGNGNGVGGLIGINGNMSVNESYSTSNVSGGEYVGGLIGQIPSSSGNMVITNNYALGDVSGTTYVGGLIGYTSR
ncbi:ZmpA/ZmpB/ZmpC family metallo-endopeptidase-related protein, partial [Bacillus sp. SM2101]|uniref:ZmpA/ZmpB/ZmpC family metallo-endopeptidase-related protein n=1 Tax=Bacillus sp. SM2101 TaxID=2805366 RepID=UPI002546687C